MHKKNIIRRKFISSSLDDRLNVAVTFNVKPESNSFIEELSSFRKTSHHKSSSTTNDIFAEWDTWNTINAVKNAIELFHNVKMIEANFDAFEKFKENSIDIVFNIAEGFFGVSREAQIPAMLDMLNIPYTGSDPLTLSICLDKGRAKEILSYHNIPTAKFKIANSVDEIINLDLRFPLIVKPNQEGSSKGIYLSSFVQNKNELNKEVERILNEYKQSALIEEFLSGREFTVAVIGNGIDVEVLPIVEIDYKDFPKDFIPIYSYEAKWIIDTPDKPLEVFSCPANIDKSLEEKIKNVCLKTYNILNCKDWSRIDIRLDKTGEPNILEINPLPGILPDPKENSCFPKAARTAGYDYNTMINKVLNSAIKRYSLL